MAVLQEKIDRLASPYFINYSPCDNKALPALLGENAALEIGFGNGQFLAQIAKNDPNTKYFGIEIYSEGIRKALFRVDELKLSNVYTHKGEARDVLERFFPDKYFSAVYVNFPDPWPKKKQKKRRLLNADSIALITSKIKSGGLLYIATDDPDYAEQVNDALNANIKLFEGKISRIKPAGLPVTKYEQRFLSQNKPINYFVLKAK